MPILVSSGSAGNPDQGILVDVSDNWEGWSPLSSVGVTNQPRSDSRVAGGTAGANPAINTTPWQVGAGITLAAPNAAGGPLFCTHVSQAGVSARANQASGTPLWTFPFRRWGGATGIPAALYCRPLRRWEAFYLFQLPGARGPATIECGIMFSPATNAGLNSSNTSGIAWTSDPAVNAGRWTAQRKLVQAAGLATSLFDSGILPGTSWVQLGVAYVEHATLPRLIYLINGLPVFEASGPAEIPTVGAGGVLFGAYMVTGPGGLGTTCNFGPARFRVLEV